MNQLKKAVLDLKNEIRSLGSVNVNAIEEFKEISERHSFLKGQHDDLVESERALLGVIDDLDAGMRRQFEENFVKIQTEFDKAFRQLFGGRPRASWSLWKGRISLRQASASSPSRQARSCRT